MMITGEVEEEAMIGEEEVKIEGKEVKSEEGEKEVKKEGKRARRDKGGKKVMKEEGEEEVMTKIGEGHLGVILITIHHLSGGEEPQKRE
jgi:hypothetical protein